MHLYLSDDFVQSTGNDKKKHPDGCPRNGEGQPEGSETIEMDNLRVQSDKEAAASFGASFRRLSQTSTDLLNKSVELAEKREAAAAAAAATAAAAAATTTADSDLAADARKAAGQAALDRSAAAVLSAAPAASNVATSLLVLQQQQQQQQQNTVINMPNQVEKKKK
jgi:hypothetical protein